MQLLGEIILAGNSNFFGREIQISSFLFRHHLRLLPLPLGRQREGLPLQVLEPVPVLQVPVQEVPVQEVQVLKVQVLNSKKYYEEIS